MLKLGDWCILRTSGGRTLAVAQSLRDAGIDAWTPMRTEKARLPRGRKGKIERAVPIIPTFVFARADRLSELLAIMKHPLSPHPPFSVFRYAGRFPTVLHADIASLRKEEERARIAVAKTKRQVVPVGQTVKLTEGGFAGLTGVVEGGDGKFAEVNFGGGWVVKISTWLLPDDAVQDKNAKRGGAAIAA